MKQASYYKNADGPLIALRSVIEQAKQEWEATVDALPQLVCLMNDQGNILRYHLKNSWLKTLAMTDCHDKGKLA